jgi:alcohol dehydrogenase (cytochrome c)
MIKKFVWILMLATVASAAPVTYQQLTKAQEDDASWISYGKNYSGWRYSALDQINASNVNQLAPAWILPTGVEGNNETTPIVLDGTMYITGPSNTGWAVDLLTGHKIWSYSEAVPKGLGLCCGTVNRGFAILGNTLFKVNIQATLVALDRTTGKVLWERVLDDYKKGFSATGTPLIVKDMVITGVGGAEWGARGHIDAYDAATGKLRWRFYPVPTTGEKGVETWAGESYRIGGGSSWVTGTYDPALNLVYWGTGNPAPDMDGSPRAGDNLYTNCIVALDADTGKMKWYFQATPHDNHDWDAVADPVLLDLTIDGKPVKTVVQANRNGYYYALDRTNGKFLKAKGYTKITWSKGIREDGRPILEPGMDPTEEGTLVCPGLSGGHNMEATAYSPKTGLYYFGSTDGCQLFVLRKQSYVEGQQFQSGDAENPPKTLNSGSVVAVDPTTGETKWRYEMLHRPSGVLATGGDLVFLGDAEGNVVALDATSGKALWHFQTGANIKAPPISYSVGGKQYIAIAAGPNMLSFKLPGDEPVKTSEKMLPKK